MNFAHVCVCRQNGKDRGTKTNKSTVVLCCLANAHTVTQVILHNALMCLCFVLTFKIKTNKKSIFSVGPTRKRVDRNQDLSEWDTPYLK